ncbi:MAG: 23S rRNA (uracil(1939)-C(5))-methyltransferase RlmD, partial [Bacteroidia bacterium]|nr:23S rRNA (uracil(1939)-C(5))-methyltransferase RlmD [Bacteroidia bacterium]
MGRKKIQFSLLEQVEIGPAVAEGNCIARVNNQVVFVKYAAPGDVADLQITGKKKKFLQSKISKLHQASDLRTEPVCEHFGVCGGCKWQHMEYQNQLNFKQQQVVDAFERIGGLQGFEVLPIIGSQQITQYRNKLELTFSNRAWVENFDRNNPENVNALGFHVPGRFDKVMDVKHCHLMPETINEITHFIKEYCNKNNIGFFDLNEQVGMMRTLMARCNQKGEWMVLLSFAEDDEPVRTNLLQQLKENFTQITSLVYVINKKRNDTLADLDVKAFSGNDHLIEELGGLKFKIRPQSFFQTNTKQAEVLYKITKDFAGLTGDELVYDLYTGTGSIALYIADKASKVVGVEYVPEAVADAAINMEINGISNCSFFAGDMKDILNAEFVSEHGRPSVVITDPPRDGMHPSVVERLLDM